MQGTNDTDTENGLVDSIGEGEGGTNMKKPGPKVICFMIPLI